MRSRNDGPADPRNFIRISIDLPINPKVVRMGNPVAAWAYTTSMCYAGSTFSDGHVPIDAVLRMAGAPKTATRALVKAGLWHLPGHDCPRCDQPVPGDAIIHDYLQHNRSAAEAQGLTEKRRAAGKAGAAKRWSGEPVNGKRIANAMAHATVPLWPEDSGSSSISPSGSSSTSSENGNGKVTEPATMTSEVPLELPLHFGDPVTPDKAKKRSSSAVEPEADSSTEDGVAIASAMASAMANAWQSDSREELQAKSKSKSNTSRSSASSEPEGWNEFWSAFPRKDGKTDAKAAYVKAIKKPGITPELLTDAASSYARRMKLERTERAKIKMGQGWLNSERWEDETAKAVEAEAPVGWWQR